LVTGSGGFVFSNFIRKALFNKSEYSFVSIDICKGPNVLNNIYANKGHKFYIGDIADKHFVDVIFEIEKPDIIIHGADTTADDSNELIRTNLLGTQVVLESCIKHKAERILHISSDHVYGVKNLIPSNEDSLLNPDSIYAATKLSSEALVKATCKFYGLNYDIARLSQNFGPRQKICSFIPKVIQSILTNKEISIKENPNKAIEWTYVEDTCSAIMMILKQESTNQIYNISSNFEFSYLEVFHEICNIFKRGNELIKFVESGSQHEKLSIDVSKLKMLGWKPSFKFKTGLFHTCDWYGQNPWFLTNS